MRHSENFVAVYPGATISEILTNKNMSQKEFAKQMGMSERQISELLNGDIGLTNDIAIKLENMLGMSAKFWNGMETLYRKQLFTVESELALENKKLQGGDINS